MTEVGDPSHRPPSEEPTVKLGSWRRRRLARGSAGPRYPRDSTDVVLWLCVGIAVAGMIALFLLAGCGGGTL